MTSVVNHPFFANFVEANEFDFDLFLILLNSQKFPAIIRLNATNSQLGCGLNSRAAGVNKLLSLRHNLNFKSLTCARKGACLNILPLFYLTWCCCGLIFDFNY